MAKAKFPLWSGEAYGKFGDSLIYQGTTVKQYAAPRDPKTALQVAVRDLFHDITKMLVAAETWPRAAWYTAFGPRWFTSIYSRIKGNGAEWWGYALAEWETFSTANQTAWRNAAPYQETVEDAGLVFWAVIYCTVQWLIELNAPTYEADEWGEGDSAAAAAWYAMELDQTLTAGSYDDDNGQISYVGTWTPITDALAYGGGYQESPATGSPGFAFYFYGTQVILKFTKDTDFGSMEVNVYSMAEQIVNQNNDPILYQQEWTSPIFGKGLHLVLVTRTGTGSISLDGIEITNKEKPAPSPTEIAEELQLIGCKVTSSVDFATYYNNKAPIPFDVDLWPETQMHDVAIENTKVFCRVTGKYFVTFRGQWQGLASGKREAELRVNGTEVHDFDSVPSTGSSGAVLVNRLSQTVDMVAGDYLEVWVSGGYFNNWLNLLAIENISPILTVQMITWSALRVQG